jgi:hypothetical protein
MPLASRLAGNSCPAPGAFPPLRPASPPIVRGTFIGKEPTFPTDQVRGLKAHGVSPSYSPGDRVQRAEAWPLTSAPASGDIFRKNGTENSEIAATPTKTG